MGPGGGAGPGPGGRGGGPEDWTAPLYPTQRGREDAWPSTTPVPAALHAPGTTVLPPRGPGDPRDRTAPLPRSGDEPLPTWAPHPARPAPSEERLTPSQGPGDAGGHDAGPGDGGPDDDRPGDPGPDDPGPADAGEDTPDGDADDPASAANWELVRAAQEGDVTAFGALFDRYHDIVFRFVLYRLGDRPLAEDLTQETFVRAYRRLDSVSYQGRDIGAWFVTIARNLVLDHVKSSRFRLESTIGEVTEIVADRASPGPESEVVAGLVHAELLRCVDRLRPDQRECIDLRFLQGLSVSETAAAMNRNEGAVKALQHRAVKRLYQLMPEGLR